MTTPEFSTYRRAAYAPPSEDHVYDFLVNNSFGTLVSTHESVPVITHLPMLVSRKQRALIGHMARANDHWSLADGQDVVCIFNGPNAYISPRWYAEKNTVPTWNYVVVHVHGTLRVDQSDAERLDVLSHYVDCFERLLPDPWTVDEADNDFIERLAKQTVAFRIEIERLEPIWKLSQHHPEDRRRRVVDELERQPNHNSKAIATLMRENLPGEGP